MTRLTYSSGSPLEPQIGFARAVRIGPIVAVSGTAPLGDDGRTVGIGDVYSQTARCIEIALAALAHVNTDVNSVVRTRIMLVDIATWRDAARAHGEVFAAIRPACTFVQVARFIDPDWLVEIEVDAVVEQDAP